MELVTNTFAPENSGENVHSSPSPAELFAFWVTNPCRITRKEFLMKQTKMYVCTLEEFILVDIWIHCCASWNCTVLYCTRS